MSQVTGFQQSLHGLAHALQSPAVLAGVLEIAQESIQPLCRVRVITCIKGFLSIKQRAFVIIQLAGLLTILLFPATVTWLPKIAFE